MAYWIRKKNHEVVFLLPLAGIWFSTDFLLLAVPIGTIMYKQGVINRDLWRTAGKGVVFGVAITVIGDSFFW
jgi:hypothetical protein